MFSKVQGLGRVKQVATGTHHMAVLTLDGKVRHYNYAITSRVCRSQNVSTAENVSMS